MQMRHILLLFGLFGFCLGVVSGQSNEKSMMKNGDKVKFEKKIINPKEMQLSPAYSQAISVVGGRTVYVSGQIPLNKKGELIGKEDLRKQTEQVFENMKIVLNDAGANFTDVVKITYFIKDLSPTMLPIIREVRGKYISNDSPLPASSLIGVQSLFRAGMS